MEPKFPYAHFSHFISKKHLFYYVRFSYIYIELKGAEINWKQEEFWTVIQQYRHLH